MNGETLTGLLKKGQMILAQAGIKEAGLDAWLTEFLLWLSDS